MELQVWIFLVPLTITIAISATVLVCEWWGNRKNKVSDENKVSDDTEDTQPTNEHERRKSARQIRAEARQRREQEYKERTLKRVKKAPGAHLYVSNKEAEAIRKSGILNGARFDTHVHK